MTINPALVFGPAHQTQTFASGDVMKGMMTSGELCSSAKMGMVDVRDVALAHLNAVKLDAAKNRRFMLTAKSAWRKEMAQCLAAEFNGKGFDIKTEERTDDNVF